MRRVQAVTDSASFWLSRATAFAFTFSGDVFTIESRGEGRWAVCSHGRVLDKDTGEFVYEPLPSERTLGFYRACRFNGYEGAFDALEQWIGERRREGAAWVRR